MKKIVAFLSQSNGMLFLILCAGSILRIILMANRSITYDEAVSIYVSRQPLNALFSLLNSGLVATQAFLFHLVFHYVLKIVPSELGIRMILVGCSMVVMYMTYKLGKLLVNEFVGLLSAALVAFSEVYIDVLSQIKAYSIWGIFCAAALYFFVKLMEKPSFKNLIFCMFFTLLSSYVHLFGVFVFAVEAVVSLCNRKFFRMHSRMWWVTVVSVFILTIPMIIFYFPILNMPINRLYYVRPAVPFKVLFEPFIQYANNWIFCIFFLLVTGYAGMRRVRLNKIPEYVLSNYKRLLVILYLMLPVLTLFFLRPLKVCMLIEFKYVLPFFISYYFIISWAILSLGKTTRKWVVIILVSALFVNALRFSALPRLHVEIKKGTDLISKNLLQDDIVAVVDIFRFADIFNYLKRPFFMITEKERIKGDFLLRAYVVQKDMLITDFDLLKNKKRMWLVMEEGTTYPIHWFQDSKRVELVKRMVVDGMEIKLYNLSR